MFKPIKSAGGNDGSPSIEPRRSAPAPDTSDLSALAVPTRPQQESFASVVKQHHETTHGEVTCYVDLAPKGLAA